MKSKDSRPASLAAAHGSPLVDSLVRDFGEQPGLSKQIEAHARLLAVALDGMLSQDCNHPGTNVTKYARAALREWRRLNKANNQDDSQEPARGSANTLTMPGSC